MTAIAALLAIDGGNSKTDLVVLGVDGDVLATRRAGPFHPHLVGAEAAVASLADGIDAVLRDAGRPRVLEVSAYMANADLPEETEAIESAFVRHQWGEHVTVENDTVAMLRTGTDRGFGVAVVCGAGINCVGIGPDGRHVRFPALGRITGDWGGGLGLAEEAMWWAVRAEDGRGPTTALATRIATYFRGATATDVAGMFHLGRLDPVRLNEIVTLLFDVAADGDEVAGWIVRQQADEIVALVMSTLRRLDLVDSDVDVVLGGGILASDDPLLMVPITEALRVAAPRAHLLLLRDDPPVVGAALMGLERAWERHPELVPTVPSTALDRARLRIRDARNHERSTDVAAAAARGSQS
jgi:N-acetylglucosamine kinase-like BadF-type ATPase